jgi:hypothetical protein
VLSRSSARVEEEGETTREEITSGHEDSSEEIQVGRIGLKERDSGNGSGTIFGTKVGGTSESGQEIGTIFGTKEGEGSGSVHAMGTIFGTKQGGGVMWMGTIFGTKRGGEAVEEGFVRED